MAFLTVNLKPELKRALAEKGYHFPEPKGSAEGSAKRPRARGKAAVRKRRRA